MIDEIIGAAISIVSVIIGIIINRFITLQDRKPKVCCSLTHTPDEEVIEAEARTKTSQTEYSVEIFNLGTQPVIFDIFRIYYKRKKQSMIVDCPILEDNRVVMPYKSVIYILEQQDLRNLMFWCKKFNFRKCKVLIYCVDGKTIKSKIDLWEIQQRASSEKQLEES